MTTGGFVVLVTGGREYQDQKRVNMELDAIRRQHPNMRLVHGKARGADMMAEAWAIDRNVPSRAYPVDNAIDGPWPAAGHRRNKRMLDDSKPDLVVAFPGARGTRGQVELAYRAGIRVVIVTPALWTPPYSRQVPLL